MKRWRKGRLAQSTVETRTDFEMSSKHPDDWYLLPRDSDEIHRLDFQHFLLRQVLQGNYKAPIGFAPQTILDVGSGTGRWIADMAHQFPKAQVVGIDLKLTYDRSPFQKMCNFCKPTFLTGFLSQSSHLILSISGCSSLVSQRINGPKLLVNWYE